MLSQPKNLDYSSVVVPEYRSVPAIGPMLDRVYSLRYKSYSEGNYIPKTSSKKFMDGFDAKSNCKSFLTYYDNALIGSIRACTYVPDVGLEVPVMEVFDSEIKNSIGYDTPFVEANKFVIDPGFQSKGGVKARFNLFRNIVEEAISSEADSIVIAVRAEHIKFYKMLYFSAVSEEKSYPHLSFKTVLLVCNDMKSLKKRIWSRTELVREKVNNGTVFNYGTN